MSKAFWHIAPLLLAAYLCAYMDRVNVGFAALQMNVDLEFSATIYGLGGGLFFLGYALLEIPSNLMLVRYGARRWIARIMMTWGLLAAGMMFIRTPLHFYVMRFLLGVAEAGFYPGIIYYLSGWFPMAHRGRAISHFYVAVPLASVVMGGVSGDLLALGGHGGLRGWQWLFLVEGLPSVAIGLLLLCYLPDQPATAAWLAEPERSWITSALEREGELIGKPAGHSLFAVFANPAIPPLAMIGFLTNGAVITLSLSAPIVLTAATGFGAKLVGTIVSVGGLIGAVMILLVGRAADHWGERLWLAVICATLVAGSCAVLAAATQPALVIAAYLGFAGACFSLMMLMTTSWTDMLHARELAVGLAALNTAAQVGAFVMPYLWGRARDATGSYRVGLIGLVVASLLSIALIIMVRVKVHLRRQRRMRAVAA